MSLSNKHPAYQKIRKLAEGAFSKVYLTRSTKNKKIYV